jgi:aspartyl-tRNA(Asn)/glutamyl-tRNA(Gln) amidotransferase subunit A
MPEPTTITEAAGFIRAGELTPSEVLEQCLARIDRYEDRVRAWVYLDREGAREQAARLTSELKAGQNRGPLHGIPVGVKDIIDVFDMPTGCGSKLWAQSYARRDATCVERLRQAGAVIMGKTVTTAYASFDPPVTRNPWNLDRTPGGSSSGSAAAVACGMCLGALATQTGGSITRPASYCGVCSLKPTYDRVSVDGVLPLAPSMDHVGVMANCVRDLGLLYRVVAGHMDYAKYGGRDVRDPLAAGLNWGIARIRRRPHPPQGVQLTNDFFAERVGPEMADAFRQMVDRIAPADGVGPLLDDVVLPAAFGTILPAHHRVMAVEAAAYHRERIARHPEDYPPRITQLIREGLSTPAPDFEAALRLKHAIHYELTQRDIPDDLLIPAVPGPAPTAETTGDPVFNSPWSFLGLPVVSLPFAWTSEGLPLAVQLVSERFKEDELLQSAERLEVAIGFARRPLPL